MTQQRPGPHNLPQAGDARVYVPNDERNTLEIHDLLQRFAGPVDCRVSPTEEAA